jgi:hypothetical protein
MFEFRPNPIPAQPHDDVLFVNAQAPAQHLYDTAARRLGAVEDLLHLLERYPDSGLVDEVARLASAIVLLVSEAQFLFDLAQQRHLDADRRLT